MDPTSPYAQAMIQQLMGSGMAAPGTTGQNASTPYGASFQTGNMMMPQQFMQQAQSMNNGQPQGMLGQGAASVLQQPMATYA